MRNAKSLMLWMFLQLLGIFALTSDAFTHPQNVFVATSSRTKASISVTSSSSTSLHMWGGNNDEEINGIDRSLSCLPYLLPLLDGDEFGKYIYQRIPPLGSMDQMLLGPLSNAYRSVPFLGLGVFVVITLQTRNTEIPRAIRFNAQQALLIDIALIFPQILGQYTSSLPLSRAFVEPATNFVYYSFMACVIYSLASNLTGKKPDQIPIISDAAEMGIGPF